MPNNFKTISCIAFDFDGTLVDSNQIKHQTFFDVTRHFDGAQSIIETALADPGMGDRYAVFEYFVKALTSRDPDCPAEAAALAEEYTNLCEIKIINAPEITGAGVALDQLAESRVKMVVSSATPESTLKKIISMRGMDKYFCDSFGTPSSKIVHIQSVMEKLKCDARQIIYVGDSEADKNAAIRTGCHFIGVGNNALRFTQKPRFLISDLRTLLPLIAQIASTEQR